MERLSDINLRSSTDVIVGPATTSRQLATALTRMGMAFPTGHCPTVAMGGYLLAGGLGWNSEAWGPACFRVRAIDVVTSDGDHVRADAENHPDLLWAARGAGPAFFGVVTAFHLEVASMPSAIGVAADVYAIDDHDEVMAWVTSMPSRQPALRKIVVRLGAAPDLMSSGQPVLTVSATAFGNSQAEVRRAIQEFDECPVRARALVSARVEETSFEALYAGRAAAFPEGYRYDADTIFSSTDPRVCGSTLSEAVVDRPSARSFVMMIITDGQLPVPSPPGAAFSVTGSVFVAVYAIWADPADDASNIAWLRSTIDSIGQHANGSYVGEADLSRCHLRRCFSAANWSRLEQLRATYDPQGVFHPPIVPHES
jgi:FAD/FMN-containing dehydrogenase